MSEVTTESNKLNNNALHHPSTLKPGTKSDAHFIISTLITIRKSPRVNSVIGKVSIMSIGFIKLFSNARTIARIIAV